MKKQAPPTHPIARLLGACLLGGSLLPAPAFAEADGPDHFQITGVAPGRTIALRAEPQAERALAELPAHARCLRNLGCQGGLSFEEFSTLSAAAKAQRQGENPRWCKLEYEGLIGWVEGRYLAEAPCAPLGSAEERILAGPKAQTLQAQVRGDQTVTYRVPVLAGQTLAVQLKASHAQTYFNVLPPDSQEAMFVGSSAGNKARLMAPTDSETRVQVYLMRAAARRGASSQFSITLQVSGTPLPALPSPQDALVAGTAFHATAEIKCQPPFVSGISRCTAGVIRRGLDGTATVQIRWAAGVRHLLFVQGKLRASDSAQALRSSKSQDINQVNIGTDEAYEIPDVLLTGG